MEAKDDTERWTALYGARDGRWMLLRGEVGLIGPATISGLGYLGAPEDVVRQIYNQHVGQARGGRGSNAVQAVLGDLLGVSQQSVSRYVSGASVPELTNAGWRALVLAHFEPEWVAVFVADLLAATTAARLEGTGERR